MALDVVVRDGVVVDGTGRPGRRADVGIRDGRIVAVGQVDGRGARVIDADGHVVTPGFVDGHTHMDAQIFWDPYGTSSSWHGVTTAVMGNCGFTLAPARIGARELVVRNLERAEDISPAALEVGIDWAWETFAEFFDVVEQLPKAINYAGYVGHSALRTWAMGERAFELAATEGDLLLMRQQLREALEAGAVGLSTSRSDTHETSDGRPVASRVAAWDEVVDLARTLTEVPGDRIFAISVDTAASSPDEPARRQVFERLKHLAVDVGVPVTFGIISPGDDYRWKGLLDTIDESNDLGGRMFGQALPRAATIILSFQTRLPFDKLREWEQVRALPLADQARMLRDGDQRNRLVAAAQNGPYIDSIGATVRPPRWDRIRVITDPAGINPTIEELARERRADPVETFIDLALEADLEQFFTQEIGNGDESEVLAMLRHPHMIPTFSDSGAHVTYVMESSIQTYLLGYWVRQRQAFTLEEAVRALTSAPAAAWGFADRGVIREGAVADLNVLDPERVGPGPLQVDRDLPGGEPRLKQGSVGIKTTILAGRSVVEDGKHTGELPGQLLRC